MQKINTDQVKKVVTTAKDIIRKKTIIFIALIFLMTFALYYFPYRINSILLALYSFLSTMIIGGIFLDRNQKYTHYQGMMLGILASISVTIGFGAIYSFILINPNYTTDHFRFTEGIKSEEIVNYKLTRNYVSLVNLMLEKQIDYIKEHNKTESEKKKNHFTNIPNLDEAKIKKELRMMFFKGKDSDGGSLNNLVAYSSQAKASKPKLSEMTRSLAEQWRKLFNNNNLPYSNPSNILTLDISSRDYYPDDIDQAIFDVRTCHYGRQPKLEKDEEKCVITKEEQLAIEPGTETLYRLFFSRMMFEEISDYNLSVEDSEFVFTAMLFSSMSFMTSGYSDMTPQTKLARSIVILQFLSYIIVVLFILPIGINKTSSQEE